MNGFSVMCWIPFLLYSVSGMGFGFGGPVFACRLLSKSTVGLVNLFLLKPISSVNWQGGGVVFIRGSTRNPMAGGFEALC